MEVEVEGVKNPKLTLAQLKQLAQKLKKLFFNVLVLKRFFGHKPRGSQWETYAVACLIWTGCPVSQ